MGGGRRGQEQVSKTERERIARGSWWGGGCRCREGADRCLLLLRGVSDDAVGNGQGFKNGGLVQAPSPAFGARLLTRRSAPAEQQKEAEAASLAQRVTVLAGRVQELSTPSALDTRAVPALRKQLWDLEASAAEQRKELERQTAAVDHLEQVAWPRPGLGLGCSSPHGRVKPTPTPSSSLRSCVQPPVHLSLGLSAPPEAGAGDRADEADPPEGAGGQGRGAGGRAAVLPEEGRVVPGGGDDAGCSPGLPGSAVQRRSRSQGSFFPGERWGGRALLSHHHPSMSPGHSPGVQNQGLGQA